MTDKKIKVQDITVRIEQVENEDYISITDIARKEDARAADIVKGYFRNRGNIEFLGTWEQFNNPDFKVVKFHHFKNKSGSNNFVLSVGQWIRETEAKGVITKSGRYGGTYAHKDIAIHFAAWLNPTFYYYLIREFQRLKVEEAQLKNLQWHVSKLTNIIDEARNLLDTIPGQDARLNRLNLLLEEQNEPESPEED